MSRRTNSSFPLFDARCKGVGPDLFRAFKSTAYLGINRVRLGCPSVTANGDLTDHILCIFVCSGLRRKRTTTVCFSSNHRMQWSVLKIRICILIVNNSKKPINRRSNQWCPLAEPRRDPTSESESVRGSTGSHSLIFFFEKALYSQ